MKVNKRATLRPILAALLLGSALGSFGPSTAIVRGQATRELSTRIQVPNTTPDITVLSSLNHIVGMGDFNGDGTDDFLAEYLAPNNM